MSSNKENSQRKKSRCSVRNFLRNPNASMHLLPMKDAELRKKWIQKLQLSADCFGKIYVCEAHFVDKDFRKGKSRQYLHHMAVPSVNLPSMYSIVSRSLNEKVLSNSSVDEGISLDSSVGGEVLLESYVDEEDELTIHIDQDCEEECISEEENNYFAAYESTAIKYHDGVTQTNVNYADKCLQTNLVYDEHIKPWTLLDALRTHSDLESWTGIPSFLTLNNIVKCVTNLESAQDELRKCKATPILMTVFVMAKLKTNLTFKQLACLFSLTPKTLANYFHTYIPILKAVLEPAIFWPSKEQVYNNLPKCFEDFQDCFGVMDCTEAPIERWKSLESNIKTYSHYKGCHTGKVNIVIVPSGLVVHVSKVYGGKASDKFIVLKEKIIEKLSAGDGLMVDKGYDIQKETSNKGIKLYRPPILDKPQLSQEEAIYNTAVATLRIHIERVIQRIKKFKIFLSKMNKSMLRQIDDIIFIVCALTNLSAPILSEAKF